MIISHTHKFIFIKSLKTAGTSIETALSNHCSGNDVVIPINDFGHNRDAEGRFIHRSMNADEFYLKIGQHVDAPTIKARESAETWNHYFKFSIARNPWDRAVSYFLWDMRKRLAIKPSKRFYHYLGIPYDEFASVRKLFIQFIQRRILERDDQFHVVDGQHRYRIPAEGFLENNDRFYCIDDDLCVDYVIRYESLEDDFNEVCKLIGLPIMSLPRLKTGIRKQGRPYAEYYDDTSLDIVAKLHKNDLRFFNYVFSKT